jgi:multiple sugar transport system ATP-binding protein
VGEIVLDHVTKEFGNGVLAVNDVNLTIGEGEFMVLVGPSGCGKTTLLRSIGGLEKITAGRILIAERDVTRSEPAARDLAMVFQNYALYPHMTVRKNLGYGLRVRKVPRKQREQRVHEVAKLLGLEELLDRRPGQLSGGQQQRVAMGRAIVREPQAFLMDEPLSNLDAKLRVGMRTSLQQLHNRLGTTTVYVTHDQVEAMTLGQRVAVMRDGKIQQVDAPRDVPRIDATVDVLEELGSEAHVFFSVDAEHVVIEDALADDPEDETSILAEEKNRTLMVARVDARTDARIGGTVRLAVDPSRLYFFSPETGESLLNGR